MSVAASWKGKGCIPVPAALGDGRKGTATARRQGSCGSRHALPRPYPPAPPPPPRLPSLPARHQSLWWPFGVARGSAARASCPCSWSCPRCAVGARRVPLFLVGTAIVRGTAPRPVVRVAAPRPAACLPVCRACSACLQRCAPVCGIAGAAAALAVHPSESDACIMHACTRSLERCMHHARTHAFMRPCVSPACASIFVLLQELRLRALSITESDTKFSWLAEHAGLSIDDVPRKQGGGDAGWRCCRSACASAALTPPRAPGCSAVRAGVCGRAPRMRAGCRSAAA